MMFFTLRDLAAVNHMYQFSLAVFLSLFRKALTDTSKAANVPSRIAMLNDKLLKVGGMPMVNSFTLQHLVAREGKRVHQHTLLDRWSQSHKPCT